MTKHGQTGELRFEQDYSSAEFDDGSVVKFTRLERRALELFNKSAGRILSRSQILDSVSEPGSPKNDRSIDFLINRIRAKLGDVAQAPRFIGTQYGEGYVWLYSSQRVMADYSDTFAVIGPLLGVERLARMEGSAAEFARLLHSDLRSSLRSDQEVAFAPDLSAKQRISGPKLTIQLGFFRDRTGAVCVVTTRSSKGDRIINLQKFALTDGPGQLAALSRQSRAVVQHAVAAYWGDVTTNAAVSKPLPIAIFEGTDEPAQGWSWVEADRRLRIMRAENPDDPAIKMMWATHIHAKYIKNGPKLFRTGTDSCAADEAEIERLVLEALDFAQDHPEHAVMAAKLLYFVDQNYQDLALELAKKAHREDASLTSTLAILGQLLGFVGDLEAAESYLSQAVDLSDDNSEEQVYALFMLIQAHMAAGHRDKQAAALKQMYRIRPSTVVVFEYFLSDPLTPSLRARAMTLLLSRSQAMAMLRHTTYLSARLYSDPRHRENALLTPVNLFVRRFGPEIVPPEVAIHLPGFNRPRTH